MKQSFANMEVLVRKGEERDMARIMELLRQVNDVHASGRPDLFRAGCTKYTADELRNILKDPATPVFVAVDGKDDVIGYCFCVAQDNAGSNHLTDVRTLYIDDLCVDFEKRGCGIGRKLYEFVKDYARGERFYNLTLNVWSCNPGAMRFYESLGMHPMKIGMEQLLTNNQ